MTTDKFVGPIVNGRYIKNVNRSGKVSIKRTMRAVDYVSYGHEFENPQRLLRGRWYDADGETTPEQVNEWAADRAATNRYTYTLIISMRDAQVADRDYLAALKAEGATGESAETAPTEAEDVAKLLGDWRLMVHRDSAHEHAHVVFFRGKTLRKRELAQIREHIQMGLRGHEQQLMATRARESAAELS